MSPLPKGLRRGVKTLFYIGFFIVSAFFLIESVFAINVFGTSKFFYRMYLLSAIATLGIAFIIAYVTKAHPWFLIVIFAVIFITMGFSAADFYKKPVSIPSKELPKLDISAFAEFPLVSSTFKGRETEPISFVIATEENKLKEVFHKDGWTMADPITIGRAYNVIWTAISGESYPAAPVTHSFWHRRQNDFAFSKMIGTDIRKRHHIRFWKTPLTFRGKTVFLATASFDSGLAIGRYIHIPTHKIDPDVDVERRYIFDALLRQNVVLKSDLADNKPVADGRNSFGHKYFTDGKTYFVELQ